MTQWNQGGRQGGLSALAWLGALVVGCDGWVDLQSPEASGGSASGSMGVAGTKATTGGAATGKTSGVIGRGQSGSRADSPDEAGVGGGPSGVAGSTTGGNRVGPVSPADHGPLVVLTPPTPTLWPEGTDIQRALWTGTSTIMGGSLEDRVLFGVNQYCFLGPAADRSCQWNTSEPFVWTEADGMVVLDGLSALGPNALAFFPGFVSRDGNTVVGAFNNIGGQKISYGGYFRWTKQAGATTLGEPVGTVSGGPEFMSSDGRAVAGLAKVDHDKDFQRLEFLWTVGGGFQALASDATWPAGAVIKSMSSDGFTLVGETTGDLKQVFLWTPDGGVESVGSLADRPSCSLNAVTKDAQVLFGSCGTYPQSSESFRWTHAGGLVALETPDAATACEFAPFGLSEDGSHAIGNARCGTTDGYQLAHWSAASGLVPLPPAPGNATTQWVGSALSRDGRVAFGVLLPEPAGYPPEEGVDGSQAFRWTSAEGIVPLGMLPSDRFSTAYASDTHGEVLVGRSGVADVSNQAVLWDSLGILDISGYLQGLGVDLHGAHLDIAERVATLGTTTIVQGFTDGRNHTGAWIAWLPRRN